MAANNYTPHYRSQFGDTTLTKVFVGGLAWETPTDEMRNYFDQFGDILEAVIISDKNTGKSKGYGFVTFRDPESARRACLEANPVIDGRRANCNIASMGRPRPSPPRGRNQGGNNVAYQGGGAPAMAAAGSSYSGVPGPQMAPVPPPAMMYPPHYGYPSYSGEYGYPQAAMYNPLIQQQAQYYQQYYGASSSPGGNPYYYGAAGGYAAPSPRGGGYPTHLAGHRMQLYYPAPQLQAAMDQQNSFSSSPYNNQAATPPTLHQPPFTRRSFSSPTDSVQITPQPATPSEAETGLGNASPEGPPS